MKKVIRIILASMVMLLPLAAKADTDAARQINSAVSRYLRGSVGVSFSYSGALGSGSGTLKSSGKKFALETSAGSCWYDGSLMWTYSPQSGETTLVKPSAGEVAEANPLYLLSGAAGKLVAKFAPKQTAGTSTIILTPQNKSAGVKRVVVVLDSKTLQPKKIDLTTNDNGRTVLTVKSLRTKQKYASSAFTYPARKYPNVKVVDLR